MNRTRGAWLAAAALVCCGLLFLFPDVRQADARTLLNWVPSRPAAAAAVLLLFYAVKSLTFFFPLAVLEAAAGLLFPLPWALGVNLLGVAVVFTLPYLLGRGTQAGLEALIRRVPRLEQLQKLRRHSDFLFVLLIRLTGVFPGDAVSLYLGASNLPFRLYLPASLLGTLPHLTAVTILGSSLSDPASEAFYISLACSAAISAGALTVWRIQKKRETG